MDKWYHIGGSSFNPSQKYARQIDPIGSFPQVRVKNKEMFKNV